MEFESLKNRFKAFALQVVDFAESLPEAGVFKIVRGQIMRAGTSTAANYRAACRRKSPKDFIAKMGIVEEELDETLFWLEFTVARDEGKRTMISPIWKEGNELLGITVTSIKTARDNQKAQRRKRPRN